MRSLINSRVIRLLKLHGSVKSITLKVSLSVLLVFLRAILSKARGDESD